MKVWIKTKLVGDGTFENPRRPYLAGLEDNLNYSALILSESECLVKVSCNPDEADVLKASNITILSDDKAIELIKSVNPNAELEDIDVIDKEVDIIAKKLGINPNVKRDIKIPSIGRKLLQDQEKYLMALISEKLGLTREVWDQEVSGKWSKGIEVDKEISKGKTSAHEFVLSKIRDKIKNTKNPKANNV